ncbi:MAG: hypothetical protein NC489_05565 [Ruminococcus flavefaciens]|nr:hypothetical protein [Ruminococcus flavefaciens]
MKIYHFKINKYNFFVDNIQKKLYNIFVECLPAYAIIKNGVNENGGKY